MNDEERQIAYFLRKINSFANRYKSIGTYGKKPGFFGELYRNMTGGAAYKEHYLDTDILTKRLKYDVKIKQELAKLGDYLVKIKKKNPELYDKFEGYEPAIDRTWNMLNKSDPKKDRTHQAESLHELVEVLLDELNDTKKKNTKNRKP